MPTKYPTSIDGNSELPLTTDNVTKVQASVVNNIRGAVFAIERELGLEPSGTFSTVRARLDALEAGNGGGGGETPAVPLRAYWSKTIYIATGGTSSTTISAATLNAASITGIPGADATLLIPVRGIVTTGVYNLCKLRYSDTGLTVVDESDDQIFGRLTFNGSNYVVTYYKLSGGTYVATSLPGTESSLPNIGLLFSEILNHDEVPGSASLIDEAGWAFSAGSGGSVAVGADTQIPVSSGGIFVYSNDLTLNSGALTISNGFTNGTLILAGIGNPAPSVGTIRLAYASSVYALGSDLATDHVLLQFGVLATDYFEIGDGTYTGQLDFQGFGIKNQGTLRFSSDATGIGFYTAATVDQQLVVGTVGENDALRNLITAIANLGLIIDGTT